MCVVVHFREKISKRKLDIRFHLTRSYFRTVRPLIFFLDFSMETEARFLRDFNEPELAKVSNESRWKFVSQAGFSARFERYFIRYPWQSIRGKPGILIIRLRNRADAQSDRKVVETSPPFVYAGYCAGL